ncbi:MAG: type II toxin-antitoxin system VapC family toxin [Planctomycetes bacterium]|nr:type II toxin-antitoxin system VapC family toxin [Planctomycetota bacterium]
MRLLLDSHTLIWAVDDPTKLGSQAAVSLQETDNDLLLNAATIWEIAIKVGLGKLSLSMPYRQWMSQAINDIGVTVLPITVEYADVQAGLPGHHGDPFDWMLVAQACVEQVAIVSNDTAFDSYGVRRAYASRPSTISACLMQACWAR